MSSSRTEAAACRDFDPELWFPNHVGNQQVAREQEKQAKAICQSCPLREACLQAALDGKERHGIWGGLSPDERVRRSLSRQMLPSAKHGTDGGYYAHRRGTRDGFTREPCEECRAAHRAADRARTAAKQKQLSDMLRRKDAELRRCSCGSWLYGQQPCGTCATLEDQGARQVSA